MALWTHSLRSLLAAAIVSLALLIPAFADAGLLVASAQDCDTQAFSQPFLPWADVAQYTLQPGGDFENGPWRGGKLAGENEPFYVGSSSDKRSLSLSEGDSAVSPSTCVGIEHPDMRFFGKSAGLTSSLRVDVLFEDSTGTVRSLPIGTLAGTGDWTLSPTYVIGANLLPLLPGSKTAVAFRFTAVSGDWQIDDVYVDPFTRW
jgi:hypothetical protein